jgi:1-acyl-sn-glycerol-3-phosphate acyltransferase
MAATVPEPEPAASAGADAPGDAARATSAARVDEARVVEIARALALEVGGPRAASAVTPTASLERDVGLGSLERVELVARLEAVAGRELGDRLLLLDSARDIARAIEFGDGEAPPARRSTVLAPAPPAPPSATAFLADVVATLPEALRGRAEREPARVCVHLQDEPRAAPVTYGALWAGAARIAGALAARGVRRGDTVGIMLPTGLDFLETFMGVLAAGAVAVPLYPPARLDRLAEYLRRQARILASAEARVLVGMPEAAPVARQLRREARALRELATADALRRAGTPIARLAGEGGDVALIQYTSGSTGDPKGVPLTHANLLANIRAITAGVELRPTDVAVSWLPLYHDMGLIGTWLCTMVQGIPLALMSPLSFLARPERWLWAIHQRRGTVSPAPNFAYELCVRRVKDEALTGLDLSSWRVAANGSEPVSPGTLDRFAARFAPHGFRREALMPVYGLAESAVALCFPPLGRAPLVDRVAREPFARDGVAAAAEADDATALTFASVGHPLPEHEVRLVDPRGEDVPDRVVGRLLFRGPSCTSGYWRNPEATARATRPGGWLDSGDLAYRSAGELYITGRVKDLVIKGGRNLVPQEIEEVAGAVDGVRRGCVVAFGVADERAGTERLVVLAESRREGAAEQTRIAGEVVARVAEAVGLPPDEVRVVPPGTVPKTPSGKLRRAAARDAYAAGRLGARGAMPLRLRLSLLAGAAVTALRAAVRRLGRGVYVAYGVLAWSLAVTLLVPPLWLLVRLLPPGRPARRVSRVACRVALAIAGCRLRVEGRVRLPEGSPCVLVANHASYADTPALVAALPLDFVFVVMEEILSWPVVGAVVRRARHPTVDRWHPRRSVADAAAVEARLRAGESVLYFPEGGFRTARALRPFRLGAFEAAVAAGVPVVPVALRGTRAVLAGGERVPHPGRVDVWIGEPLRAGPYAQGEAWRAALALRDRAADAIAAHCGEPRLAATAPVAPTGAPDAGRPRDGVGPASGNV